MQSMTLTRYDPDPPDAPTRYQVAYDVILDSGQLRYYPVTVVADADALQSDVLAAAQAMIMPGITAEEAPIATTGAASMTSSARIEVP